MPKASLNMTDQARMPARSEREDTSISDRFRVFWKNYLSHHFNSVSFITLHYAYFFATCTICAVIFWSSSTPPRSVSFVDSVFFVVSAMTEAGMNTVNLSQLNTWQQIMLFLLIIIGSSIFVSIGILHIRKRAFEQKLEELAERKRAGPLKPLSFSFSKRRQTSQNEHEEAVASGAVRGRAIPDSNPDEDYEMTFAAQRRKPSETKSLEDPAHDTAVEIADPNGPHITFRDETRPTRHPGDQFQPRLRRNSQTSFFTNTGVAARGFSNHPRNAQPFHNEYDLGSPVSDEEPRLNSLAKISKYISGYVGRNSQFHHLSEKERRKLGGIEYDAICLLSYLVPIYFVLFQVLGCLGVGSWITINSPSVALENGLNPFWTGAFFAVSAFNNSGMALLDANAVALQTSYYCLLTLSLLILAGNTCFPPFLRLIVWSLKQLIPENASPRIQRWKTVLNFILDHPRRVYTNLFPAKQTWWLVFSLVLLNGIDWIAFEVLNLGNPIVESIPPRFRVLDGLFQAFAVRSGGFYVVTIAGLYPGLLVLYVLMMYVSAYPVTMTIRSTNVYEERSLGIFADELAEERVSSSPADLESQLPSDSRRKGFLQDLRRTVTMSHGGTTTNITAHESTNGKTSSSTWTNQDFLRQQLRGQLGHDLWLIGLAVMLICIVETSQFKRDPVNFSIFNVLFEVVSAYGCVGISVGVPWNNYSFCGAWHTVSKLILCAVMLRGRHRGLPVAIDRAILLPSESLAWAEEEDAYRKREGGGLVRERSGERVGTGSGS